MRPPCSPLLLVLAALAVGCDGVALRAADRDGGARDVDASPVDGGPDAPPSDPIDLCPRSDAPQHEVAAEHTSTLLFDPARDRLNIDYHTFRIPSLIRANDGALIAFAEGRQCSVADFGNINVVFKRSTDGGRTWGPLREVVGAGAGTWGNPTAVLDRDTGDLWLFMSWNAEDVSQTGGRNPCTGAPTRAVGPGDRPVKLSRSTDDGETWSAPIDLTAALQPAGMTWDAVGPGVGIQLTEGEHRGRLVVPATHRNLYSDDHGETWRYAAVPGGTSEGTVVELADGSLLRNDRAIGSAWERGKRRWLSRGTIEDGFAPFAPHDELLDPRVEGSSIRFSRAPHRILMLNPASTVARCRMRMRLSYDGGATWPIGRPLHDQVSAAATCDESLGGYSSLAVADDCSIGALSERRDPRGASIEFHRVNLPWLLDGAPEPE